MPRRAKPPRLYVRERAGREAVWVIRDGTREVSTGICASDGGAAERELEKYLGKKHRPNFTDTDPESVMIADCLGLYAEQAAPRQKRADMVTGAIRNLVDFFGSKRVAALTPHLCRQYVEWRTSQRQSKYTQTEDPPFVGTASARRELEVLSASIGHAFKERKLKYLVPVTLPEKSPARLRWLTEAEIDALLAAARTGEAPHLERFILIGLYTGTRHTAILGLRWDPSEKSGWVDLDNLMLYRKGSRETESDKRRPPVPISAKLAKHLREWKSSGGEYVVEWEGEKIKSVRRAWNTAVRNAGLSRDVTPHVLRHTFATRAMQLGLSTALAAEAMGVSEAIFRATYGHHASEPLREVVESVSGAEVGAKPKKRVASKPRKGYISVGGGR